MRKIFILLMVLLTYSSSTIAARILSNKVYVEERGNRLAIGNEYIERVLQISSSINTIEIKNKLTGSDYLIDSEEFRLKIDQSILNRRDFSLVDWKSKDVEKGKQLIISLHNEEIGLDIDIFYDLHPDDFYLRKWLEIETSFEVSKRINLHELDVERFKFKGVKVRYGGDSQHNPPGWENVRGFGQPLFTHDLFMGLEFPAGYNYINEVTDLISLTHYPANGLFDEKLISKKAVIGVSANTAHHRVEDSFKDYIIKLRHHPPELYISNNNWLTRDESPTLKPEEELSILHKGYRHTTQGKFFNFIENFAGRLYRDYGISVNSIIRDSGWHLTTDWLPYKGAFPNGLEPVIEKCKENHTHLGTYHTINGFWILEAGEKYGFPRREYAAGINSNVGYCFTPEYVSFAQRQLTDIAKNGVGHFKCDHNRELHCIGRGHGHLPRWKNGFENSVDGMIAIMDSVYKVAEPYFYSHMSVGMWASPWWLKHTDFIKIHHGDWIESYVPSLDHRQSEITARDEKVTQRVTHTQYPVFGMRTHGLEKADGGNPPDSPISLPHPIRGIADEIAMYVGRGQLYFEGYFTPELLTDDMWDFMASAIKWAQDNEEVLLENKVILGDPSKRETYGYAHFTPRKGIIMVRNPFIESEKVSIFLDEETVGMYRGSSEWYASMIYPYREGLYRLYRYGDSIDLEVQGYQGLILELTPVEYLSEPGIINCRYEVARRDGNHISYNLWGSPGTTRMVKLVSASGISEVNGTRINSKRIFSVPVDFKGRGGKELIEDYELRYTDIKDKLLGHVSIYIPENQTNPNLILFCERGKEVTELQPRFVEEGQNALNIICKATNNGKAKSVHKFPIKYEEVPPGLHTGWLPYPEYERFSFFTIPLDRGMNKIDFELSYQSEYSVRDPGSGTYYFDGEINGWLYTEDNFDKEEIKVKISQEPGKSGSKMLPITQSRVQKLIEVFSPHTFQLYEVIK
jgi:hypothetical protein